MLKSKSNNITFAIGAALISVLLLAGTAFGEASSMTTYVDTAGGSNPEANSISFTAYYNGNDSKIHTEDSWNDTNNNEGYVPSAGVCRANPVQMGDDQSSQSYNIWISYSGTAGNQGGTASGTVPSSGTGYTSPGTSGNPVALSTSKYLATPTGFEGKAGDGEAFIKWNSVSGATGYRVYKRPAAGEGTSEIIFERVGTASGSQIGVVVTGLTNGTTYNFIMVATDSTKRSGHPAEIPVTPTSTGVPTVSGPSSGTKGQSVTITGSNFGSTQGSIYFNGVAASSITSWSDTQIVAVIASGTPTGTGKLAVVTSTNLVDSINFTVNEPISPVNITTTSLPNGTVGITYSATLAATGGNGTYSWSITSSALPAGLNLNASTGVISGTPTAAGTSNFTVQASSEGSTDTQPLSITINPGTSSKNFTIAYLSETQAENWISVPYSSPEVSGTLISTIGDLMDSLGGIFAPQNGDIMTLSWYDNTKQTASFALRDYNGTSWNSWDPTKEALLLVTGKMYIFSLSNPGRTTFTKTWTVKGIIPAIGTVTFPFSYLSETQAENWISVPNTTVIKDNGDLMDSLAGKFTPQSGDIMTLSWYDNTKQTASFALRDYNGTSWNSWDPAKEVLVTSLGEAYKVSISNPGRPTFTVTWP